MKLPARTETAISAADVKRAHELDAKIKRHIADTKEFFAEFPKDSLPSNWIDESGFKQFIKSRGIMLTEADEVALLVFSITFNAGGALSPETILDLLRQGNPARKDLVSA